MGYTQTIAYTIPAGGSIANLLAGQPPEFFGGAAKLTIYGSADTAGDSMNLSRFTGHEPGQLDVPTSPIPVASTAGAVKTNENFITQLAIPGGSRMVLAITGVAAHVGRIMLVVE